jgi:alpha-beta hydrolase superfamily lysophospholipase
MQLARPWKIIGALWSAAIILGVVLVYNIGAVLVAPSNHPIGNPPAGLRAQNVEFPSASGATIHGWFVAGEPGRGVVVLMHGVHADRMTLIARAQFLSRAGYSVLLFDFQGHGESQGRQITFGFLESRDATAAVKFIHGKLPGEKVGVIGISLGAASALLANPPLPVNAMILESWYPTIYQAAEDRLAMRFGWLGKLATPLLTCQFKPRLGISLDDLKPLKCARNISVPKFFLAGTADRDTTIEEARSLFAAAAEPKQAWWVDGAAHVDLHAFAQREYERRVLAFLANHLYQNQAKDF